MKKVTVKSAKVAVKKEYEDAYDRYSRIPVREYQEQEQHVRRSLDQSCGGGRRIIRKKLGGD
jgi:hypothetical protein